MKEFSEKQLIANRENAKKGGVKTDEGKQSSKKNALKHGVLSLMKTQYEELKYEEIYNDLAVEYEVVTTSQRMLLDQLVTCLIKLGRCAKFETKITLQRQYDEDENEFEDDGYDFDDPIVKKKFVFDKETFQALEPVILKYEPMLVKRMTVLMNELRGLRDK